MPVFILEMHNQTINKMAVFIPETCKPSGRASANVLLFVSSKDRHNTRNASRRLSVSLKLLALKV